MCEKFCPYLTIFIDTLRIFENYQTSFERQTSNGIMQDHWIQVSMVKRKV